MQRRNFLRYSGTTALGAGALGLVGCGGDDEEATPSGGATTAPGAPTTAPTIAPTVAASELAASQVLRTRFYFDLLPMDPNTIFGIEQENTAIAIYNGLTKYSPKTELEADLATGWEQPDPTTWTFKLNTGVKWHKDYGDFVAQDVVASYNRIIQANGTYSKEFALIDSITAPDATTVQFKLKKPDANFGHQVSNYHQGSVINVKAIEKLGADHGLNPIGTGPFVLSNVRPGQGFDLTRFDNYFKGKATLEKIEMRTIADHNTAAIAIKNSELDVVMALRSEPSLDQAKDPNIEFSIGDQWGTSLWIFNTTTKSLGDIRVRQAMASALDLPASIKATSPRLGTFADNIVPPWMPEYSADVPKYPTDLKKSKELLSAAGVPDGVTVKFMSLGNPSEFFTLIQASLAAVGIKLEFEIVDRAQFNQRRVSGDHDITNRGYPTANIDSILFNYLHPDNMPPNGFNGSRYNNPDVVAKMEAARSELDTARRKSLYAEIQKQVMTDLPYLATNYSSEYWAYRKNIKGLGVNRMPQGNWYDLQIAKS